MLLNDNTMEDHNQDSIPSESVLNLPIIDTATRPSSVNNGLISQNNANNEDLQVSKMSNLKDILKAKETRKTRKQWVKNDFLF